MSDWSKEPLVLEPQGEGLFRIYPAERLRDDYPHRVIPLADMDHSDNGSAEWRLVVIPETAKRLVGCYNALAGISDPAALVESFDELLRHLTLQTENIGAQWGENVLAMIARAEAARGEK